MYCPTSIVTELYQCRVTGLLQSVFFNTFMIRNDFCVLFYRSCLSCIEPAISTKHLSYQSFQLFGFDFMVDENFKVWLIEINGAPACAQSVSFLVKCTFVCKSIRFWLHQSVMAWFISRNVNIKFSSSLYLFWELKLLLPSSRKLYPELCQGIVDVAISSVFTLNSGSDSSSASSSPYSSSPSSLFTTNSCSSPKLRAPLHVGPFTRL